MRAIHAWIVILLCLLAGCGSGKGSDTAISDLQATWEGSSVRLQWTPFTGEWEEFEIEARLDGISTQCLDTHPFAFSSQLSQKSLPISAQTPELGVLEIRIRPRSGSRLGPYSNWARLTKPLRGAGVYSNGRATPEAGVRLRVFTESTRADHILVERATSDASGHPIGAWEQALSLAPPFMDAMDTGVQESSTYVYRVTCLAGSARSEPSYPSDPVTLGPRRVTGISVTPIPGGVRVAWTNPSRTASQVTVACDHFVPRWVHEPLATLAPDVTHVDHLGGSIATRKYHVATWDAAGNDAEAEALGAPDNLPGAVPLVVTPCPGTPLADTAEITPAGTWIEGSDQTCGVFPAPGAPWPSWQPANASLVHPQRWLRADAQGLPQATFTLVDGLATATSAWARFDGTAWVSEPLPGQEVYGWTLDAQDRPLAIVGTRRPIQGEPLADLAFLRMGDGGWSQLPLVLPANLRSNLSTASPWLGLDPTGFHHLLIPTYWDGILLADGDAADPSALTLIPGTEDTNMGRNQVEGYWKDGQNAWVFCTREDDATATRSLVALRRINGAWQPFEALPYPETYRWRAAMTRDGSRVALLTSPPTDLDLFLFTSSGGAWTTTRVPIPPIDQDVTCSLGFDQDNRIHVRVAAKATGVAVDCHE